MSDPLPIDAYAEIVAHLRYFRHIPRGEVLRALDEDEPHFTSSEQHWSAVLLAESDEDEPTANVVRFGAAYDEHLRRLRRERPRLQELGGGAPASAGPTAEPAAAATSAGVALAPGEMSLLQLSTAAAAETGRAGAPLAEEDVDTTREQTRPSLGPALPFGGARSPEFLASLVRPVAGDSAGVASKSSDTEDVDVAKIRSALFPFGPGVLPAHPESPAHELTLEDYAALRARLLVAGEHDVETWKGFGITSASVKEEVQARFAERFRVDPDAQRRFLELVHRAAAALRGPGRGAPT